MIHGAADPLLAHAPDGLELCPDYGHVHGAKGGEEEALCALAAVKDQVSLKGAHRSAFPLTPRLDRHLALEGSGLRCLTSWLPQAAGPGLA